MDHVFLWNIHVSCNSSCATRGIFTHGIITCGIVTHGIITHGTGHACDSHEWNMCRHKRAINICYSSAINKNMSNSVHNCESPRMNYQGNGLIAQLTIVVSCSSVSQLYKYKQSGNKVRSM